MADIIELKPVNKVQNIINKFCYCIGMLPTSYKASMTYEEQLVAIGQYLEETVIPALNNNAEVVAELQNLYIELKNYVDNYFDNLNVQEEINNKINNMINNGSFQELFDPKFNEINNSIINLQNTKRDKSTLINLGDLSQEVKEAMTGGSVAVVGNNSVNDTSVQNGTISPTKMNFITNYSNNLLDLSQVSNEYYDAIGVKRTDGHYVASPTISLNDAIINQTKFNTNVNNHGWILLNNEMEFIKLVGTPTVIIDDENAKYLQLNISTSDATYLNKTAYITKDNAKQLNVNKLNQRNFLKNDYFLVDTDNIIGNTLKPDNMSFINHITNNLFNKNLADKNGYFDNYGNYYLNANSTELSIYGSYIMQLPTYIANETLFYQNSSVPGFINFFDINFKWLGHLENAQASSFTIPYENAIFISKSLPIKMMKKYYLILGTNSLEDYYQLSNDILLPENINYSILKGKKIGFLGDSITYGLSATKPYPIVIQEKTACVSVNYGISGNSLAKAGSNGQENAQTNPMCIRYANMSDDLDYIVVFGGSNDYDYQIPLGNENSTNIEEFNGALNTLITGLIEKYPGKPLLFLTPLYRTLNLETGYKFMDYVNAIKSRCAYYSIPCFNLTDNSTIKSLIDTINQKYYANQDRLHPNDDGHKILARIIQHHLEII